MFPSLVVLDTLDKSGKDAYNNVTMMETVNRIPDHLFLHGQADEPSLFPIHHERLKRAISRLGSLDS